MNIARSIRKRVAPQKTVQAELPIATLTLNNATRFLYAKRLFDQISGLDGDIVECGVGMGTSLQIWTSLCHDEGRRRCIWGFDSFEGFPEPTREDTSPRNPKKGEWKVSTPKTITNLFVRAGFSAEWVRAHLTLVPGYFEDSLPKYTGESIALLHLDADLYQSYRTSLEQLYEKVVPGGIVAFDEYMGTFEHIHFPGARKAIDEFFQDRNVEMLRDPSFGKYYLVKPS